MASVQVRILQSGRTDAYGLPLIPGSVVTVDRDYAVSLISTGFASWMNPADAYDGETNLRKLSESYSLYQSGIPFWLPPGDGGANGLTFTDSIGNFTLSAAVVSGFWNLLSVGGYGYLPAGAGGLVSGGWFWCVMTSDTAGRFYADTYNGWGDPLFVGSPQPFSGISAGRITQSIAEVSAFNFVIPGGSMGPNGVMRMTTSLFGDASATKTYRWRSSIGNAVIAQTGTSTSSVGDQIYYIRNRGIETAQFGPRSGQYTLSATVGGAWQYTSLDYRNDQTITVSLQATSPGSALITGLDASVQYGA